MKTKILTILTYKSFEPISETKHYKNNNTKMIMVCLST